METLLLWLAVAHLYCDCNPAADLISRQRWPEFRELCALQGTRPRQGAAPLVAASAAGDVRISPFQP